jgi:hypothetical protein
VSKGKGRILGEIVISKARRFEDPDVRFEGRFLYDSESVAAKTPHFEEFFRFKDVRFEDSSYCPHAFAAIQFAEPCGFRCGQYNLKLCAGRGTDTVD